VPITAASHLVAGGFAAAGTSPIIALLLNWGVPILAILQTVKYTRGVVGADAEPSQPA
jgi:hypothetical protein